MRTDFETDSRMFVNGLCHGLTDENGLGKWTWLTNFEADKRMLVINFVPSVLIRYSVKESVYEIG